MNNDWQRLDVDSMPRSDTRVIISDGEIAIFAYYNKTAEGHIWINDRDIPGFAPTHWLELKLPPKTTTVSALT